MSKAEPDLAEFQVRAQNDELRRMVSVLQQKLARSQAKAEDLVEAVYRGARDASIVLGNPPGVPKAKKELRRAKAEVALLHLSDWQIGKRTGSYDSAVACQRIKQLAYKVEKLVNIERSDHPVVECHVLLGGDLIEGVSVFPGQAFEVDSTSFEQQMTAKGALQALLRHMCASFERVHVWQEEGNHGRIGRKGDYPRKDNADLMVYQLAREGLVELEKTSRLFWHERQSWHQIAPIGNYRALLVHGDEVKSFGGNTPAFGIARKVASWAADVIEPFTDCYMGHWHQPLVLPLPNGRRRTFVNPSIESDNVYAQEFVGAMGAPGQRLNFIDPERGRVTSERIVWLD